MTAKEIHDAATELGVRLWLNVDNHVEAEPKDVLPRHMRQTVMRNLDEMRAHLSANATVPSAPETHADFVRECKQLRAQIPDLAELDRDVLPGLGIPDAADNDIDFLRRHYDWLKAEVAKPPVSVRAEANRRLWAARDDKHAGNSTTMAIKRAT